MLLILSGLPGVGKTAVARGLARHLGALHLRIDSIEQAIRDGGADRDLRDAGYRVAYAVAEDNLRLGHTVVADSVNPIQLTRDSWLAVAERAAVRAIEIEVICSDLTEHKRRVETRLADIPRLQLPAWSDVLAREYHPWQRDHLVLDTAGRAIEHSVKALCDLLTRPQPPRA
jgi:predicted kinase